MVEWIEPGNTIGIVGGGRHAYHLTLAAKRLGYEVGILAEDKNCLAFQVADWIIEKSLRSKSGFIDLSMQSDVVLYSTDVFNSNYIQAMQKSVSVPQEEELLSVAQDRILQKVFLESNSINIAPYSTVLTIEDIQSSVDSIGYPCVLKTNQDEGKTRKVILHNDTDIQKAKPLLNTGTCVLEAWVDIKKRIVANLVRDQHGQTLIYPNSEMELINDQLYQAVSPVQVDQAVEVEINRIAKNISDQFRFVGFMSLELFITDNGFIYLNEVSTQPHEVLHYTNDFAHLSHYEAFIKAITGMPIIEEQGMITQTIQIPFYTNHVNKVKQQMQIKPNWKFNFYPQPTDKKQLGYILIPTDDLQKTRKLLEDVDLWSLSEQQQYE